MRRALSVTSECVPLIKTGGLADVAGALPGALAGQGWEMRTILPGYPAVMAAAKRGKVAFEEDDLFGGPARVLTAKVKGLQIFAVDAPHLYNRDGGPYVDAGGYDWGDNAERFAALSWAAARIGAGAVEGWTPDVLHAHDWQAGFTPLYMGMMAEAESRPGTVLTIHNIAFHGLAPSTKLDVLRLPRSGFTEMGFEFWGQIGALKAGIVWADWVTTVSPTYAAELMTPDYGWGLDGVLRAREHAFSGILNGIDTEVWDPSEDPEIATYKAPGGKTRAKAMLRKEFDLPETDGPLAVVVSRLSQQKGLDLLLEALPALIDRGGQLVLLGTGDRKLETDWLMAAAHPNVAVTIGYDEGLAHRLIAGGDALIVPSRFEPCGLTQQYALRYGTIPVVSLTGGLSDTVINASPMALRAGVATGIQFHPVSTHTLAAALMRLVTLFQDRKAWTRMQRNGMRQEVSWDAAAAEYAAVYDKVAPAP